MKRTPVSFCEFLLRTLAEPHTSEATLPRRQLCLHTFARELFGRDPRPEKFSESTSATHGSCIRSPDPQGWECRRRFRTRNQKIPALKLSSGGGISDRGRFRLVEDRGSEPFPGPLAEPLGGFRWDCRSDLVGGEDVASAEDRSRPGFGANEADRSSLPKIGSGSLRSLSREPLPRGSRSRSVIGPLTGPEPAPAPEKLGERSERDRSRSERSWTWGSSSPKTYSANSTNHPREPLA